MSLAARTLLSPQAVFRFRGIMTIPRAESEPLRIKLITVLALEPSEMVEMHATLSEPKGFVSSRNKQLFVLTT